MDLTVGRHRSGRSAPTGLRASMLGALVWIAVCASLLVPSTRAAAVLTAQQEATPTVRLVEQAPWLWMGDDIEIFVAATGAEDAEVTLSVHSRVDDRESLVDALGGDELGTVLGRRQWELGELETNRSGSAILRMGTQEPTVERDENLVAFEQTGVYPVRVSIEGAAGAVDEFITFVVAVERDSDAQTPRSRGNDAGTPVDSEPPYPVAFVIPVESSPLTLPDGEFDQAVLAELRPGGRLDRIVAELAEASAVPATLAVGPETASSWSAAAVDDARVAAGIDALRASVERADRQVVSAPYVRLDIPALVATGLSDEISTQYRAGADALTDTLGVRVDPRLAVVDPVDDDGAAQLREDLFVDRIVVPEGAVDPVSPLGARGGVHPVESISGDLEAALADPFFYVLTTLGGSTALQAQRVLATLALDQTGEEDARGAVVTFPHDWDPDEGLTELLLAGLDEHPLLEAMTIDEWFSKVPTAEDETGEPVRTSVRAIDTGTPAVTPSQLANARFELASLESLLGEDPRVERGRGAILRAPSADFLGVAGIERARADLDQIGVDAGQFLSGITTEEKTVTLTGKDATIPLTFFNDTDRSVEVLVQLDSEKLVFPEGEELVVDLPVGSTTRRIPVEARATGTFPMFVGLATADRVFEVGEPSRITVRTALLGGVGGWITIGAAGFLGVWWMTHAWRSRRHRSEGA